jgi:hypothetical protein
MQAKGKKKFHIYGNVHRRKATMPVKRKPARKPVVKPEPIKEPVAEPIIEPEPILAPKKENTILVKAEVGYSNGQLATNWRGGEIREITPELLQRLRADLPRNWTVVRG